MITNKQMNFIWCQLCKRFNKSYMKTEEEKLEYYELLKNNSFEKLQQQIDKIISNNKFFPKVEEILGQDNVPYWMKHPEICKNKTPNANEKEELENIITDLTKEEEDLSL